MKLQNLFILLSLNILFLSCDSNEKKAPQEQKESRPNILLILADDMGYSDLGCYGSEINTPNLDLLAQEGTRFTQFYNSARCCPTRASLLTGISPHLTGMGGMVRHKPAEEENAYQGYLNTQCVTLAEVLKPAGYRTYMSGKWHVGEFRPVFPVDRGFDKYYGLISGGMNYWNIAKGKREGIQRVFAEDTTIISDQINNGFYSTTAYTDKALSYLDDHFTNHNESPFLLYVAHQAPHWPLHAPDTAIAKYRGKYKAGWEALRNERYERMVKMGLIEEGLRLPPLDEGTADWDALTEAQKDSMDLKMAVYAAMIDIMDENIGRIIQKLEDNGQLDNTLIMFLSDNGASSESGALGLNFRPDLTGTIGSENSYHSYGLSWANASNTPYQKFKKYTYEGGIATPFIVNWGNKIRQKGSINQAVGHITDIMATVVDVAEAEYPNEVGGKNIHPLEGKSLVPILVGDSKAMRTENDMLIWEHEGNKAVRMGDWKLVKLISDEDWKLFDLGKDKTELADVSKEFPEVSTQLKNAYKQWAAKVGVVEKN